MPYWWGRSCINVIKCYDLRDIPDVSNDKGHYQQQSKTELTFTV